MNLTTLRDSTSARVGLGSAGHSLPTHELLKLQYAHAQARQAVHAKLDIRLLGRDLQPMFEEVLFVQSAAKDRFTYLRRPDLGRQLSEGSVSLLVSKTSAKKSRFDAAFVIVDGLSALAVQQHAPRMVEATLRLLNPADWNLSPAVIVEQGRVAIGDQIGDCLGAALAVVLIGERPGLSSPDSLGIYLTWNPHPGLTDADRNCVSNIHAGGLGYEAAAHKLGFLMNESRRRRLSGVPLKEEAGVLSSLGEGFAVHQGNTSE